MNDRSFLRVRFIIAKVFARLAGRGTSGPRPRNGGQDVRTPFLLQKSSQRLRLSAAAAGMALLACTASAQTIGTPEEREAFLERVGDLGAVTPEQALEHYADATDPFHPDEPVAAVATDAEDTGEADVSAGPSDREVLEALVERVRPTGVMTVGGERVVLFGERRIRAGDVLRFNYEGEPHQVTVGAIGARSFTLQLGDEEILKPVQ